MIKSLNLKKAILQIEAVEVFPFSPLLWSTAVLDSKDCIVFAILPFLLPLWVKILPPRQTHQNLHTPDTRWKGILGVVNNPPPHSHDITAGETVQEMNEAKKKMKRKNTQRGYPKVVLKILWGNSWNFIHMPPDKAYSYHQRFVYLCSGKRPPFWINKHLQI